MKEKKKEEKREQERKKLGGRVPFVFVSKKEQTSLHVVSSLFEFVDCKFILSLRFLVK